MKKFDSIVSGAFDIAQSKALEEKHVELDAYHFLWGLIKNPRSSGRKYLKRFQKKIEESLASFPASSQTIGPKDIRPSAKLVEWITKASSHATLSGREEVCEEDFLRYIKDIVEIVQIDEEDLKSVSAQEDAPPFLVNLNELADLGKLDPVIGRQKEIRALMEILGRRGKNNPVLVGAAGVGKTAIVEGLAEAIVKGHVPDVLQGKTVYALDMGSLMAGTKFQGEFEERLQKLISFVKKKAGQAILFVDEMHQLVGAGRTEGAMDAANLLKPALARGELHCIGATTDHEYQKYILGDQALDRRFRAVPVEAPKKEDAVEILMGVREKMEIHHGIKISDEAVLASVFLSDQYITDKNLPDKAIDLIDEASSALKLSAEAMPAKLVEKEALIRSKKIYNKINKDKKLDGEIKELEEIFKEQKKKWEQEVFSVKKIRELKNLRDRYRFEMEQATRQGDLTRAAEVKYSLLPDIEKKLEQTNHQWVLKKQHIAQIISRQTSIPPEKILRDKQGHILKLESYLKTKVYGQDEAIKEIANTLVSSYAGLGDDSRPLGSFLLKGPSGVGKTATSKGLALFLFDSESAMIRLDMSEFSEKHSVSKLIGAPAGYIGYEEGGVLTEAVRKRPYSVLLFDEIEKAHYDFSDILLQILDDGRLTDNRGRTVDFKNTIIFLTTNSEHVERDFRPEVLGRLDAILTYRKLDRAILKKLVERELGSLNDKLKDKSLSVVLDDHFCEFLVRQGHDPRYGARPLNAVFKKLVAHPLSKKLLEGTLEKGLITGTLENQKTIFHQSNGILTDR